MSDITHHNKSSRTPQQNATSLEDELSKRKRPIQNSVVHLQSLIGNQGVQRLLNERTTDSSEDMANINLDVPSHVSDMNNPVDTYTNIRHTFQANHPKTKLQLYREELAEPSFTVQNKDTNGTTKIRRMGRASNESREDLETAPITDDFVRDIFEFFYPGMGGVTNINDNVRELAARMLHSAISASRTMDLVPRPPGGRPGLSWLGLQAVQAAWRRGKDEGIYVSVRNTVAARHRSDFEMARAGIL